MYVTIPEICEYLHLSQAYVLRQIQLGNIWAVYDGKQYLVNKDQFVDTRNKIEQQIRAWKEEQERELPPDIDVKDED